MADYTDSVRAEIRRLFASHGYQGGLRVVDDSGDETTFLVAPGSESMLDTRALSIALQALLRRKVRVVDEAPKWAAHAELFT
jgi:hypothetical protein